MRRSGSGSLRKIAKVFVALRVSRRDPAGRSAIPRPGLDRMTASQALLNQPLMPSSALTKANSSKPRRIRVASVQFESAAADKDANFRKIETFTAQAADDGVRLVIFPECCVTGY